ncbi:putative spore cortex biosynthesis protein YabQ [Coprococcus sp. CAG:782]|jgi:hypothetical protein|uniref:spore cortex biosynthesis protein YabQ n=1 Tax=Coprococcus sp. OM04-5BH TaxID=2293093 RepID=UPI00033D22C7|nr:hypothetical protein DXB54_00540 [Coprococcus sp. OM04-5BH]CCY54225.1 putative spore cortex biosynthesis protein YabQ [Coprococcus sp. CAG:782]
MTELIRSQTVTFLIFILFGSASGITLDVLRALQKCLHMYNIINILLDIAYGLAICVITIGLIYVYSQGNLYFYHIFGFFLGNLLYFTTISCTASAIFNYILCRISQDLGKVVKVVKKLVDINCHKL